MSRPTKQQLEAAKRLRTIATRQRLLDSTNAQLQMAGWTASGIAVLQKLKAAHEAALAKLLAAAPEKVTAKGEAE